MAYENNGDAKILTFINNYDITTRQKAAINSFYGFEFESNLTFYFVIITSSFITLVIKHFTITILSEHVNNQKNMVMGAESS